MIEENCDQSVLVYMVGNRCDLEEDREVTEEDLDAVMKELHVDYQIETSALTGKNVSPLFENLTKHLYMINGDKLADYSEEQGFDGREANELKGSFHLKNADLYQPKEKKKKGCAC